MKRIFIVLLALLPMCLVAQNTKKVAVYITGDDSGINKVLGDQLVSAFARSGKYIAVERTASFLTELSKEQSYQRTGAVNDNDIAALGVQFGVQYVCVADVSEVFGEKYISARLIDVETAEIVNTHNVSGQMNSMNKCIQMASEIAENLTKGTFAEQEEILRQKELEREASGPKRIQTNYQDYEVLPGDLDGSYTWSNAKSACANLTAFGKSDWYLPNKEELNALYKRKDEIGGFTGDWYWSSSEYVSGTAYGQRFSDGYQTSSNKDDRIRRVRCVRKN